MDSRATSRMRVKVASVVAAVAALSAQPASAQPASAQPAATPAPSVTSEPEERSAPDAGYIGREVGRLEIDDCRQTELTKEQARKQGFEHYERGATLYAQGDYDGAVREFVYGYCLVPSAYSLLQDIGQAYERNLDYEKAIGYLERYVREVPPTARATRPCDPDPQQDKANVARRVEVLRKLKAKIHVESSPAGARITIANDAGIAARARSGETIEVLGGRYEMTTELDGHEPHRQAIDVRIGKPYTYFVPLIALKGRLSMQVQPPGARIFIGDRFVGIGHVDLALEGNTYVVTTEAPDRITDRRQVEVLANQVQRVQVSLTAKPQIGRRQLIVFSTVAGGSATFSMLYAFRNTGLAALGSLGGTAAGLFGGMFLYPDDLPLATSNLTITSTIGGAVLGTSLSLLFTERDEVIVPVAGASAALAGAFGYIMADQTRLTTGDAALINSGVMWGSVAGGLFAATFDTGPSLTGGLLLSGLGMGTVGGLLLQRNFSVSRTRAALIDVGGLIGIIGGLAASSPGDVSPEQQANFALGGMAAGLLTAGILTRNLDAPRLPVSPAITQATTASGRATALYGLRGSW